MLITSHITDGFPLVARERAAGGIVYPEPDDSAAVRRLLQVASEYDIGAHGGKRLECFLILENQISLWIMQTAGVPEDVHRKVDVLAVTVADLTAKTLFVQLPAVQTPFPPLDRDGITRDSETTVHLVVAGGNDMAEALVVNAALVAHYPNYCRDHRLRTRITVVDDDVSGFRDRMLQRYCHLFEHSYYRSLDLGDEMPQCVCHTPLYRDTREDFVDVEWEFVSGSLGNAALRRKFAEWACNPGQQLTLAVCHDDMQRNFTESLSLPEEVYRAQVPVLCRLEEPDMMELAKGCSLYDSVLPFGSGICSLDTLRALKEMAKRVNYVYNYVFSLKPGEPVSAPSAIDTDVLDSQWAAVPSLPKQYSNIFNAMTFGPKMHSLGHSRGDWDTFYAVSMNEVDILTEVEHNRWSVEELILGYRPVTDAEQKLVEDDIRMKKVLREQKIHYDLRAFSDLREDGTGKNVDVYDKVLTQGIPLIIKSCITS